MKFAPNDPAHVMVCHCGHGYKQHQPKCLGLAGDGILFCHCHAFKYSHDEERAA